MIRQSVSFEATPLVFGGLMYLSTPLGRVIALDPETGTERWVTDLAVKPIGYGDFTTRGVSLWADPAARARRHCAVRVIVATVDARLTALDARDGRRCDGLCRRRHRRSAAAVCGIHRSRCEEYEVTSPPAIVNGVIVVGSAVADNNRTDAASGEVRGFDARTGGSAGPGTRCPRTRPIRAGATWIGPAAHRTGAANAWSVLAADSARGLVFLPTGSASPDYFGGERQGENRYANSIVALEPPPGRWSGISRRCTTISGTTTTPHRRR